MEAGRKDNVITILIDNLQEFGSEKSPFAAVLKYIVEKVKDE